MLINLTIINSLKYNITINLVFSIVETFIYDMFEDILNEFRCTLSRCTR